MRLYEAKGAVEKIGLGQPLDVVSIREHPAEAETTTERMNQGYATRELRLNWFCLATLFPRCLHLANCAVFDLSVRPGDR